MKVFTKEPFEYCYTLPPYPARPDTRGDLDATEQNGLVLYMDRIFDLKTGELLYDLADFGDDLDLQGDFSSEGWLRLNIGDDSIIWDPASGETMGKIHSSSVYFYGDTDPETGRLSAGVIRASNMNWRIYQYFDEPEEVPEQLDELITMVRRRIGDIRLSKAERKEYKLDDR